MNFEYELYYTVITDVEDDDTHVELYRYRRDDDLEDEFLFSFNPRAISKLTVNRVLQSLGMNWAEVTKFLDDLTHKRHVW